MFLNVCRIRTNECADIVAVEAKDGSFVAVVRDVEGREAAATGVDESTAIISAAMKLFEPSVTPEMRTDSYMIKTEREAWYCYVSESKVSKPNGQNSKPDYGT